MIFKVSKSYYNNMSRQLNQFEDDGIITSDQRDAMVNTYEVVKSVSLIRLISVVGAVLVGLGILTYIAGNWQNLSPTYRMLLILMGMVGFYVTGMQLDRLYPRTGRALRYIALFIYGGGLFLTDQTFHLNRAVSFHFLIWSAGVLVTLYFERDSLLLYFYQMLIIASSISLLDSYRMNESSYMAYLMLTVLGIGVAIRLSELNYKTRVAAFLNGIAVFFIFLTYLSHIEADPTIGTSVILILGLVYMFKPLFGKYAPELMSQLGLVLAGFSGFVLTFADTWSDLINSEGTTPAVIFTIVMLVALFYLVKKGYVGAIAFIALVIMRYYFDTFYDFMPKSMFFIIGGGLLIGFGIYLESARRKGGSTDA